LSLATGRICTEGVGKTNSWEEYIDHERRK
jgi:hypothetical protein